MEEENGTDLSKFLRSSYDSDAEETMKRVPSLPQIKPHFIVMEYCGRRSSRNDCDFKPVYLEEKINPMKEKTENKNESESESDDQEDPENPASRIALKPLESIWCKKSFLEKSALIGGTIIGGAIGIYLYKSSNE